MVPRRHAFVLMMDGACFDLEDHTLERAREIQDVLRKNKIRIVEGVHEDIGHKFPPSFDQSIEEAFKFILER